jgi:hypothetical protein
MQGNPTTTTKSPGRMFRPSLNRATVEGALDRLDLVSEVASGNKVVANPASGRKTAQTPIDQGPYFQGFTMEPATGIEPATCGLRNRCSTN